MFGGINPKQMQGMMKKMGIAQEEIDAKRVIIKCEDKEIVIDNPSVIKIKMQGNESFQISGEVSEENTVSFTEEDVEIIMEKTGKSRERVVKILEKNSGDIAQTIFDLKEKSE